MLTGQGSAEVVIDFGCGDGEDTLKLRGEARKRWSAWTSGRARFQSSREAALRAGLDHLCEFCQTTEERADWLSSSMPPSTSQIPRAPCEPCMIYSSRAASWCPGSVPRGTTHTAAICFLSSCGRTWPSPRMRWSVGGRISGAMERLDSRKVGRLKQMTSGAWLRCVP